METPQDAYRRLVQVDIDHLIQQRDADYSWLPDLPAMLGAAQFEWQRTIGQTPRLEFPFDRKLVEGVKEKMLGLGFRVVHEVTEQDVATKGRGTVSQTYCLGEDYHKYLVVAFNDERAGSVCKRRKIGTAQVEQPIYEFTCE